MDEVMAMGNEIVSKAPGNTKVIMNAFTDAAQSTNVLIVTTVISLLICFFGLKLMKVLTAFVGLILGAVAGLILTGVLGVSGFTSVIIVFACAIILAVLSFFLYRLGVFFTVLCMCFSIACSLVYPESNILLIVYAVVSVILAILAAVLIEPFVIVVTSVSGGLTAGRMIAVFAGLSENLLAVYGIGLVILAAGLIVQFMLHSRKVGKKEKQHAEIIKEKDSVESEVEKARMILDESEETEDEDEE